MKNLARNLRKLLNDKNIVDIIIFGSFVKNKINANDIDIAVIVNHQVEKQPLKDCIKELIKNELDLQIITINDYDKFIWITLIREGYSVKHGKYLHEVYKIKPVLLYKYTLKKLTVSKKVMFERAIKNFKKITRLSNRVVLVPIEYSDEFSDFLRNWDIDIESEYYGLLPLVRKSNLWE